MLCQAVEGDALDQPRKQRQSASLLVLLSVSRCKQCGDLLLSRGGDLHALVSIRDEESFAARVTENAAQSPSQQGPMQRCSR